MRQSNETFEAEVLRRSKVYQQKQRTRIKQATAGMLTLCLCFGAFGIWKMQTPKSAVERQNAAQGTFGGNSLSDGADAVEGADDVILPGRQMHDTDKAMEEFDGAESKAATAPANTLTGGADGLNDELLPLTLELAETVTADTAEIVLLVTNPNVQAVTVGSDAFCIEFTDPNGEGMAIMPAPAEESSAAASAYTIAAGESIRIALPLSLYQLQNPLPPRSYCISCIDQASTAAEFTVEVN